MDINELQSFKLSDAVKFHDELNPKLWTKDGKLLPEVQEQLEKIAEDFVVSLGISDLKIKDITISGSNAAYSYTPHSDLDLHVLVDFNELPNDEVYKELFNAKKTVYNDSHDIKINDIPVELYVQDINQKHTSLGEYSVKNKDWVKFPIKRRANLDQKETKLKYEKLGSLIELAITLKDLKRIDKVLDTLRRYRRAGLDKTGEFGPENLAYKLIRSQGLLQALIDTKNQVHSKNLSLPEDQVLEVIDMPKKNYSVTKSRYYADEINFTTKKGNDYMVGFRNDVYKNRPNLSNKYPKFKSDIDERHQEGKEVYFDNLSDDRDARKGDVRKDTIMQDMGVPLTGTGDEFEVFSKVSDIINYYLRTRKPKYLLFATDERRANLYKKIFKKLLNDFSSLRLKKIPYKNNTDIYIAYDSNYFQDDKDVSEAIDLKNLVADPSKLKTYKTHISPEEVLELIRRCPEEEIPKYIDLLGKFEDYTWVNNVYREPSAAYSLIQILNKPVKFFEKVIAKSAWESFHYAYYYLWGPFPLGEKAIANSCSMSVDYANFVLKAPFPLGEPAIAKCPKSATEYALYVLKEPWPPGEPIIYRDKVYREVYEKDILKGRPWTNIDQKVDESIDLKKLVSDPKKLKTVDTHISPEEAFEKINNGETDEYLIRAVAKSPEHSYFYARHVLKNKPFPLGEPAIAKDELWSYEYAKYVLNKPFPLGEPTIAKDAEYAYHYALDVLQKPWPLGEPAIIEDPTYSYLYAQNVIGKPWPPGEPAIYGEKVYREAYEKYVLKGKPWTNIDQKVDEAIDLKSLVKNPKKLKTHDTHLNTDEAWEKIKDGNRDEVYIHIIANNPYMAYTYANEFLGKRFELGEPAIATSSYYSEKYAEDVLNGRFKLGEPAIAEYPLRAVKYAKNIIKGRFKIAEPTIAKNAQAAFIYARDVLKGPFPLGEKQILNSTWGFAYSDHILRGKSHTERKNKKEKVDEAIDLKKLVKNPKRLKNIKTHISPKEAYRRLKKGETDGYLLRAVAKDAETSYDYARYILHKPFPLGEPAIAKDAEKSYQYAYYVLDGPFPLGEPAIAKDKDWSYNYADSVLQGPFPLGEPTIAKFPVNAYNYAKDILKKPFPLGEPAIATDALLSYLYAKDILKKPFPLGEPTIFNSDVVMWRPYGRVKYFYEVEVLQDGPWTGLDQKIDESMDLKKLVSDPQKLQTYDTHISPKEAYERLLRGETDEYLVRAVAKEAYYALYYAIEILKGPFPLGEPAIAKKAGESYLYAREILKGPFPLGEPTIYKDSVGRNWYEKFILKGKPWTNIDQKIDEGIDLEKLVKNPKRLKNIKTHISPEEAFKKILNGENEAHLEQAVAKDKSLSYTYAKTILKGPFALGEPAIAKDANRSYHYARYVLKNPFPLGEPTIAKDGFWSIHYAIDVRKGPFPLGEPAIATETEYSYYYALHALKGPFPLGEPIIYRNKVYKQAYEDNILKGKPWTNIDQKIDEGINLKKLVKDPTKLTNLDKYVEPKIMVKYIRNYAKKNNGIVKPKMLEILSKEDEFQVDRDSYRPMLDAYSQNGIEGIAKNLKFAYQYAKLVSAACPALEPILATKAKEACHYALMTKKRFPLGERAIARSPDHSYRYAKHILKGPFPKGERAISKHGWYSIEYPMTITNKPFPLGEPLIAIDYWHSYRYARYILKGPFPLGEPAIYVSNRKDDYEKYVLKGRPWTGLKKKKVDEAIDLKKLVSNPKKLKTVDTHISPEEAFKRLKKGKTNEYLVRAITKSVEYSFYYAKDVLEGPFPLGEPTITKSAIFSYLYAKDILKGPFPMGEPTIAKDEISSYMYARDVLNGPFASGEPAIAKSAYYSYLYAKDVLNGPFALGEPTIAKDALESYHYARDVLKGPFPLAEPTIYKDNFLRNYYIKKILKDKPWTGLDQKVDEAIDLKKLVSDPTKLKTVDTHISPEEAYARLKKGETGEYLIRAVAKSAEYSYRYASKILKGPFPLGEPAIAKDIEYSYWYAKDVLNGPFALGEPVIATDGWISILYALSVLKGPFPLGEPAIAKDSRYSYRYTAYILKKPFPLGEPAIAKHPMFSYRYAKDVLKKPFPLGEPAIYRSVWEKDYETYVLKGRPWTGLGKKVTETNIDESASGYIPSKKEANDPRYSMALTVDIKPDTMQQNAKKLGWKISRKGIPPLLFKPKS